MSKDDVVTHFQGIGQWYAQAKRLEDEAVPDRDDDATESDEEG